MKTTIRRLLAIAGVFLIVTLFSSATTVFVYPHGHGQQTLTNYGEDWDYNYGMGYTAPIVGWSSSVWGNGYYALTATIDTDYAAGYYYYAAYQTNMDSVTVYLY